MNLAPIKLEGRMVRLEPLSLEYLDSLSAVGLDPEIWKWTTSNIQTRDDMRKYIEAALEGERTGSALPFVVIEQSSAKPVGSTRFGNFDHQHRRVEIGWTWISLPWQRTAVNTEAKYLLLRYAFETLGCIRVEFKTDALNTKSRQALLRIGAKEEGTLRRHMILPQGRVRDSVYFSVIAEEWPDVKLRLEEKLTRAG